jgi:tetratricopeptide (TPR) repeat protein
MGRFRWLEMDTRPVPGDPAQAQDGAEAGDLDEFVCCNRAAGLLRQGQYENALQWFSRALRFQASMEDAWVGQVQCLLALGEYTEANIWADRALERFQDAPDLLAAKALALGRSQGRNAGMAYSDAAMSVKGKAVGAYPWIVRGDLLLDERSSRQAALRCFNKAIELAGKDWYTYYLIADSLAFRNCCDLALSHLNSAVVLEKQSALLYCLMGECYERLGDIPSAKRALQRAREADPTSSNIRRRLEEVGNANPVCCFFRRLWRRCGI